MDLKHRIQFVWPGLVGMSECCTSAVAHYIWTSLGGRGGAGDHLCSSHWAGGVGGQCQLTCPGLVSAACTLTPLTHAAGVLLLHPPHTTQPKHQSFSHARQSTVAAVMETDREKHKSLQQSSVILQRRGEIHPWLYQFGEWLSTVSSDCMACLLPPCTQGRHKSQVFTNVKRKCKKMWSR